MKRLHLTAWVLGLGIAGLIVARYGEAAVRGMLLYLSTAVWIRRLVTHFPPARRVAQRFVAGETIAEAVAAARVVNQSGMVATINVLGESVDSEATAVAARGEIMALLKAIHDEQIDANISIKPSQLGINLSLEQTHSHLRLLLEQARQYHNKIRLDMEDSSLIDTTLQLYRSLRDEDGFTNVGVVIQAYLYRSQEDVRQLVEEGAWVRLVKGAYAEPPELAFPAKADTNANFITLAEMMLHEQARHNGVYLALATHDEALIRAVIQFATRHQIPPNQYEFQMLYGVRQKLQQELTQTGYQVRVYIPYGTAWYPYFMRRLAERPANLWFFVSNLLRN